MRRLSFSTRRQREGSSEHRLGGDDKIPPPAKKKKKMLLKTKCLLSFTTRPVKEEEKDFLLEYYETEMSKLGLKWIEDRFYRSVETSMFHAGSKERLVAGIVAPNTAPSREIIMIYDNSGRLLRRNFNMNGSCKRENNRPPVEFFHPNGKIRREAWQFDAEFARRHPMVIEYSESGQKIFEEWATSEKTAAPHREDGPAVVEYWENGRVKEERWRRYGKPYRPYHQPSTVCYYENGAIQAEYFPELLQGNCNCWKERCYCGYRKFENRFYTLAENKRPDHEEFLKGANAFPHGKKPAQTQHNKKKKKPTKKRKK